MSRHRNSSDSLPFDTLTLEGGLFVPELLEKAARGEAAHQTESDYGIPKGLKVQEEYGRAYRIASAQWQSFASQLVREDVDAGDATNTFIIGFLRDALGFADIQLTDGPVRADDSVEREFPVGALALDGRIPVIIAPHDIGLDEHDLRFAVIGGGTRKKSPFQLAQEFLNAAPNSLWAICTNGKSLRLLRDADTLTRPAFLEFDIETVLREGEDRYPDFSALWSLLHASRAGSAKALPSDCIWERWKTEGHAQGLRVRDGLRDGVTEALLILGSGFLTHRNNSDLRQRLHDGDLTKDEYFQQLLRLVYRCLFLFCAEERTHPGGNVSLLHSKDDDPSACDHYATGYSLRRLRTRSLRRAARDRYDDLWRSVTIVFRSLASGEPRLALPALGGLFTVEQCPDIDEAALSNRDLLAAMRHLRWSNSTGGLTAIDYRNMGPEELGSIYESLLELIPTVDVVSRQFGFVGITDSDSAAGNTRKTTGSYYTPDSLVTELIKSALDPVIEQKIAERPDNPIAALLSISVIDPACGSGHFLISAARRLAERLAELRAPDGAVHPADYRHALREVISHCIYGVDRNPMALELARTALWLEGYDPGQPLSFLDHHLQCGDALLGLTSFDQLRNGIAKDAFKALSGDDKETCKNLAAKNRDGLKALVKRLKNPAAELFDANNLENSLQRLEAIEAMADDSTVEVEAKKVAYAAFLTKAQDSPLAHACNLLVAAYLTPKTPNQDGQCPTTATLIEVLFPQDGKSSPKDLLNHVTELCQNARVFHWPLRFAHIFGDGGFDCVLGNPPWERIKLQEQEFFASRSPDIAKAKNKAERGRLISALQCSSDQQKQRLYAEFISARRLAEATSTFAHVNGDDGGRFSLTGVGDVNTYALFAETISQITAVIGRAGFIVPMGIATDDTTKAFFADQIASHRLAQLIGMWEIRAWFPATDDRKSFCLVTLGSADKSRFIFDVRSLQDLSDPQKWIELPPEDLLLINPNTQTCPVFRSQADADLTKTIYRRVPVLQNDAKEDAKEVNPWGIRLSSMFHMSNDSHLFIDEEAPDTLPLYEAKMMHQFDHRWADYSPKKRNKNGDLIPVDLPPQEKQDTERLATPRYWVPERNILAKIASAPKCVRDAYRDQNGSALLAALAIWIEARHVPDLLGDMTSSNAQQRVLTLGGSKFDSLPASEEDWLNPKALTEARDWDSLTDEELEFLRNVDDLVFACRNLLKARTRDWTIGWRRNARNDDERSLLSSIIPMVGVGDSIFLATSDCSPRQNSALVGNLDSLILDYVMRQKLAGSNLSFYYLKQLPVLPPNAYSESDLTFIVPRVLELTYTAHDLSGWARDLGHDGPPFAFKPDRRAVLRAELDARYARLYGLTREELQYILDPATTHGEDYPTVTFPGLKKNEIKAHGEYRTQRLVLEAWDREEGIESDESWQDRAFELLAPERNELTDYRMLVWPELLRQATQPQEFQIFLRAYWLLCEPIEFSNQGQQHFPDLPATWWTAGRNMEHTDFIPTLRGSAELGDIRIQNKDGVRYIQWTGPPPNPSFPEAIDDARVALQVSQNMVWSVELDSKVNETQLNELLEQLEAKI